MTVETTSRLRHQFVLVLTVGIGLWLYSTLAKRAVDLMPGSTGSGREWQSPISFDTQLLDIGLILSLTVVLLLIHQFERTSSIRRAIGIGILLAIIPMAAVVGAAEREGLVELAIARAVIATIGVVGASVLVYWFGRQRLESR